MKVLKQHKKLDGLIFAYNFAYKRYRC